LRIFLAQNVEVANASKTAMSTKIILNHIVTTRCAVLAVLLLSTPACALRTTIAAGAYHACVLLDDASIKCWGHNGRGQLGLGDTSNRGANANQMGDNLDAVDLGTGRTAMAIVAGQYHTCALLDDASIKCWGYNENGQLGLEDVFNRGIADGQMGDHLLAV